MGRRCNRWPRVYSRTVEAAGRRFDLVAELAMDTAAGARPGGSQSLAVHFVSERMRPEGANGWWFAGGTRRHARSSCQPRRAVPAWLRSPSTALAPDAYADGAPPRNPDIVGRGAGGLGESLE